MGSVQDKKWAWVTLVTRESYVPGAVILAHSLKRHNSAYPLFILYTPSLPASLLPVLSREAKLTNSMLMPTTPLNPSGSTTLIADRFADTWTKLRVFSPNQCGWTKLCFLDADMLILKNMDEIFDIELPPRKNGKGKGIAAGHVCVCNLDQDSWAPGDWNKENCAYTGLTHPTALTSPTPVPDLTNGGGKQTHTLLNSGLFLFEPSKELWDDMLSFFQHPSNSEKLSKMLFPDQDFLALFFRGEWKSTPWQYNALKTWRYWHPEMWSDGEVRNLHYIVDKPWAKRVGRDGEAGYLGKDGVTHSWWWRVYEQWFEERIQGGEDRVVEMMGKLVAERE